MLALDKRAGSIELAPHLAAYDVPVEVGMLDSADVQFIGQGDMVNVGVECKTIGDLVNSMRSGRLSGFQLGRMCESYDYAFLLIIGAWRPGPGGELLYLRGRDWRPITDGHNSVLYRALQAYRFTLGHRAYTTAGNLIQIDRVGDYREAAAWVVSLYKWFEKPLEQHRSHEAIYQRDGRSSPNDGGHKPKSFIRRPVGDLERFLHTIDGIDSAAKFLANRFESMDNLVKYTAKDIAETPVEQFVKGGGTRVVRLGIKKGERVWQSLRKQ